MSFFCRLFCFLSFLGFSTVAVADDFVFNLGMDTQWRSMPLQKGFGDNIVKKHYPQGSVYGGMKFNDIFGFELGYQRSVSADRKGILDKNNGANYFGVGMLDPAAPNDYWTSHSKVSTQGFYTGVLGFLPISEEYRLKFIASIGVVRMKTKIITSLDFFDSFTRITTMNSSQFNFIQTKWIPKVGAGIQHMINDNCGVRAMATWEQTNRFNHIVGVDPTDGLPSTKAFASLKNSTTLGLGLFYNF